MITLNANAKINLTLDILGLREDGYHEVAMVMQEVSLHDTLSMEKSGAGIQLSITIEGQDGVLPAQVFSCQSLLRGRKGSYRQMRAISAGRLLPWCSGSTG